MRVLPADIDTETCPGCFHIRRLPKNLPVCDKCIRKVPVTVQVDYASAYFSGDKKRILDASARLIEAAS